MDLDGEIDRLYGLPLDEFVGERGDLARALRGDGDREGAARIAKLRKPTVGAWALNQAVRIRRGERDELLAAGERLRDAHEALAAGAGDADELRAAMAQQRLLAAALAGAAEAIATEAGRSGPALRERVRSTLLAAAVDETVRAEVAGGRVVKEHEGGGLGPFAAGAPATVASPSKRKKKKTEPPPPKPKVDKERAKRLKNAEQAVAAAHGAHTEAKGAADAAAEAVADAKQALAEAQGAERAARQAERERAREVTKRERELEKLRAG